MTDTIEGTAGADNARTTEQSVNPAEVFATNLESETLSAIAEWLKTQTPETIGSALLDLRRQHVAAVDMREYHAGRAHDLTSQVSALHRYASVEHTHAVSATQLAYADHNPLAISWEGWANQMSIAFEVGIRAGHANETRTLAFHLDRAGLGADSTTRADSLEAMAEQIASTLRENNGGELPHATTAVQGVADTIERRRRIRANLPEMHPADPRLADGWRLVWQTAKRDANFCDTFDHLAEALGVPDEYAPAPEPKWEGTVIVTVTVDIPVYVSGLTSPDTESAEDYVDSETIADAVYDMGRGDIESAISHGWEITADHLEQTFDD